MAYKRNCSCGGTCGGKCGCNSDIIDINCLPTAEWNQVDVILGVEGPNRCNRIVAVEKPLYELSAEDREKLDALKLDGDGTYFLADDGTYKKIDFSTDQTILTYDENPANFIIKNQTKLSEIWNRLQEDKQAFIHMNIAPYILPINYAYGSRTLILEYDRPIVTIDGENITYTRLKILIAMYTDVYPFNVIYYDVKNFVDADGIVITSGDGSRALFDDGTYKATYTKIEVDGLIDNLASQIADNTEDISGIVNDITSLTGRITTLESGLSSIETRVDTAEENISTLQTSVENIDGRVTQNTQSIADLSQSTQEAFNTVNGQLDSLDSRVTVNEGNIEVNRIEIENLRDDFTNAEKFRGYFETTDEITSLPNPTPGDYAWNAQTGTIWTYNGTTWANTGQPIPDQTVTPSESVPQVPSGTGEVGISTRYMRADAVIPSDPTKVNIEDLEAYLPLEGNTQATRMTGDIWLSTGNKVRFTNSGNSNLGHNNDTNTTELLGNGVGGVDIQAPNGTVKANGEEIVTYNSSDDIEAKNNVILKNNCKILGTDSGNATHNLIELSRFGIIDAGSSTAPFNITSSIRPTIQLSGETGVQAHNVAFVDDINTLENELTGRVDDLDVQVAQNTADIETNETNIENIRQDLAARELFRGYYTTTVEITSLPNPVSGNYAWNAETGTVWVYSGTTWTDSGDAIPDQTVIASDQTPAVPFGTGYVGESEQYMRADAIIPADPNKTDVSVTAALQSDIENTANDLNDYKTSNDQTVSNLESTVATNSSNISGLNSRVTVAEGNITTLQNRASGIEGNISTINETLAVTNSTLNNYIDTTNGRLSTLETNSYDLQGRVGSLENQGSSLVQRVTVTEQNILTHNGQIATNTANIATLQNGQTTINNNLSELESRVSTNESNISTNTSDIASILQQLADTEHFRGYYQTTDEVTSIPNPEAGDYAWNGETNTVWLYNGTTWTNSGQALPDVIVTASDSVPLIDGVGAAGTSEEYARGDHRHPTDTSRAAASDVSDLTTRVDTAESTISGLRSDVDANTAGISANGSAISTLQTTVGNMQGDVSKLQADVAANASRIEEVQNDLDNLNDGAVSDLRDDVNTLQEDYADLTGRVTAAEGNIGDLQTADGQNVKLIGNQTITGVKTFNSAIRVNAAAIFNGVTATSVTLSGNLIPDNTANPLPSIGAPTTPFNSAYITTLNGANIISNGDGTQFLSDDGTYKPISGDYLPLSGGTVTGNIILGNNSTITPRFNPLSIPTNADLNSYITPGIRVCQYSSTATSLQNCPTTDAFGLHIIKTRGGASDVGVMQIIYNSVGNKLYIRNSDSSGNWTVWQSIYTSANFNPSSYLPLSGGTVTGNIVLNENSTVTARFSGIRLTDSDNIDTIIRPGQYFASGGVLTQGTFPSGHVSSSTFLFEVLPISNGGAVYHRLTNGNNVYIRTYVPSSGALGTWYTTLRKNDSNNNFDGSLNILSGNALRLNGSTGTPRIYYNADDGFAIRGNVTTGINITNDSATGNINLNTTGGIATYNGDEIATVDDIITITNGDGIKFLSDNGSYKNIPDTTWSELTGNPSDNSALVNYVDSQLPVTKTLTRTNLTGSVTPTVTLPANADIVAVNYNNIILFSDQYSYSGTSLSITDAATVNAFTTTDRIEVTYYI